MNTWFTSDLHLLHFNCIKYCNRPFKTVEEMDETLINNWNNCVQSNDQIYFLGDFCLASPDKAEGYIKRLNGKHKYWILGNHDHKNVIKRLTPYFEWVKEVYMLTVQDINPYAPEKHMSVHPTKNQMIWLSHYPHLSWGQSHYGVWHLHGHCHNTLKDDSAIRRIDVGVDCFNFRPISYAQLKELMMKKTWAPKDEYRNNIKESE